jgi:hypothetical protein
MQITYLNDTKPYFPEVQVSSVCVCVRLCFPFVANIFILITECGFCLLSTSSCDTAVHIWQFESPASIADRNAPWKTARRNEKLTLLALPFQQVGVCCKLRVGAGVNYDIPKECFMEVELTLELITLFY